MSGPEPQPRLRFLIEALAVTLSKRARCRALQLPAWNEALGLPRPWDQQWSLRMQQILAFETDLLEYEDLFDGSHVVDGKTAALKAEALEELASIDAMGGAVEAVGYMKESLVGAHIERVKGIESGSLQVIGVNAFTQSEESPLGAGNEAIQTVDPMVERQQIDALNKWRSQRDTGAVERALVDLKAAATSGANIMEPSIAAAKAGATTGEWGATLREVFGEFRGPTGVSVVIDTGGDEHIETTKARVESVSERLGRDLTYVLGKPGLDGLSNGAEQIAARVRP